MYFAPEKERGLVYIDIDFAPKKERGLMHVDIIIMSFDPSG